MTVSLIDLFHKMEDGGISAPDFTRAFVWGKPMVIDLLESIYLGYPVGTILVVEGKPDLFKTADTNLTHFPAVKDCWHDRFSTLWVIDGLQRLVALYGALKGDYPGMDVYFDLRQDKFLRKPRLSDMGAVIKMSNLFNYVKFMEAQEKLFQSADSALLFDSLNRLHRSFIDYPLPLQVVGDIEAVEVANVFARLNGSGRSLSRQELQRAKGLSDPKKLG
jgi:uncharacterized protein with ParB-like and HNH nuclease domain